MTLDGSLVSLVIVSALAAGWWMLGAWLGALTPTDADRPGRVRAGRECEWEHRS